MDLCNANAANTLSASKFYDAIFEKLHIMPSENLEWKRTPDHQVGTQEKY